MHNHHLPGETLRWAAGCAAVSTHDHDLTHTLSHTNTLSLSHTHAARSAESLAPSLEEKEARPLAGWVRCCLDALEGHGFAYRCAFISSSL